MMKVRLTRGVNGHARRVRPPAHVVLVHRREEDFVAHRRRAVVLEQLAPAATVISLFVLIRLFVLLV